MVPVPRVQAKKAPPCLFLALNITSKTTTSEFSKLIKKAEYSSGDFFGSFLYRFESISALCWDQIHIQNDANWRTCRWQKNVHFRIPKSFLKKSEAANPKLVAGIEPMAKNEWLFGRNLHFIATMQTWFETFGGRTPKPLQNGIRFRHSFFIVWSILFQIWIIGCFLISTSLSRTFTQFPNNLLTSVCVRGCSSNGRALA